MNDTPPEKTASHPVTDSSSNPPSNHHGLSLSSPSDSSDIPSSRDRRGGRLRDVFPPGCGSKSKSDKTRLYAFSPFQLYDKLLDHHHNKNKRIEQTVVKAAWYGKQTKSARHEFIVVQVEDLTPPGLVNYIALDRNQGNRRTGPKGVPTASTSSSAEASDAFRVAYDGDLPRFLEECKLGSHETLEEIHFQPNKPLQLLKLVALVYHISEQHPTYNPLNTNCYWFTGLIWECMLQIGTPERHKVLVPGQRGKFRIVRILPSPFQVRSVLRGFEAELKKLDTCRNEKPSTDEAQESTETTVAGADGLVTSGTT